MSSFQRLSAIEVFPVRAAKASNPSPPMPGKENAPTHFKQTPSLNTIASSTFVVGKPFNESKLGAARFGKDSGPVTTKGIAGDRLFRTELSVGVANRPVHGKVVSTIPETSRTALRTLPDPKPAALAEATRSFRSGKGQHQGRPFKRAVAKCLDLGLPLHTMATHIRRVVYHREPLPEGTLTQRNDNQYNRIYKSVHRISTQMKKVKSSQVKVDNARPGIAHSAAIEMNENDGDMELVSVLKHALDRLNANGQNKKRFRWAHKTVGEKEPGDCKRANRSLSRERPAAAPGETRLGRCHFGGELRKSPSSQVPEGARSRRARLRGWKDGPAIQRAAPTDGDEFF